MVASVLTYQNEETALDELLQPEPLAQGAVPEQRVVYCGLSWNRYLAFDHKLGDDRRGPRLYFLDGELEIMTTSIEHEQIKKWIGGFLEISCWTVPATTSDRPRAVRWRTWMLR